LLSSQVKRDELADLGLRFDLTVPLVRFYAHNMGSLPTPLKSIQIGPVWRAESPQQGRFRQFTQCDIDIIGVKSEAAETELIHATSKALLELGFKDFTVRINDRRILTELAEFCEFSEDRFEVVFITLDKLDKIGLEGVRKELNAVAHSGEATDRLISILEAVMHSDDITHIISHLPQTLPTEVLHSLRNVIDTINETSGGHFKARFDPTLVRGMGYYTGQIFEISAPGYSHSIAGGGRYDKMVGKFSGRDTPACGFSIGFERIINILTEKGFRPASETKRIALIFEPDNDPLNKVMTAASHLRSDGSIVSTLPRKKDMRKQLDALFAQEFGHYCVFREEGLDVRQLGASK
ncbi:MAG: histidine--tRNA ligase, partial [Terriglobales bacterium]